MSISILIATVYHAIINHNEYVIFGLCRLDLSVLLFCRRFSFRRWLIADSFFVWWHKT